MVDTRESRAFATEKKFVLDAATALQVREWARARLDADPHGTGPFGDEYVTSSLYFDNEHLDVFCRRGSYGRAKFRIRRYSEAEYAFIERKLRRPNLLVKRRTQVPLEVIGQLAAGDVAPRSPAWWFYERVRVRHLSPVCLLSYRRLARGVATPNGPARLTIDHDLRVAAAHDHALEMPAGEGVPILEGRTILELKYRGVLPVILLELVRTFRLQAQAVSKYRLGMIALGHEPAALEDVQLA